MDAQPSQLSRLVSLISEATKLVESRFMSSSNPYVPSLDDTDPHPLDTQLSDPALRAAVQTIEGACAQLCALVARPSHTIVNVSTRFTTQTCKFQDRVLYPAANGRNSSSVYKCCAQLQNRRHLEGAPRWHGYRGDWGKVGGRSREDWSDSTPLGHTPHL